MPTQRADAPQKPPSLEATKLRIALGTASAQAARGARRLRLGRADRDDLRQDILVALLERLEQFDPARGGWGTFASMIARTVVADRARASRGQRFVYAELDLDQFPAGASATQQDYADPVLTLDLKRVAAELPLQPQELLRRLAAAGDVAATQRSDARSSTAFYRAIADLRCWLRAAGMRPQSSAAQRRSRAAQWEKSTLGYVEKEMPNHA